MNRLFSRTLFWPWLKFGVRRGWCSDDCCSTHDGIPMTADEGEALLDGNDPCIYIVRLWPQPGANDQ